MIWFRANTELLAVINTLYLVLCTPSLSDSLPGGDLYFSVPVAKKYVPGGLLAVSGFYPESFYCVIEFCPYHKLPR